MLYTVQISKIKYIQPSVTAIDITVKSSVEPWSIFAHLGDDQPIQNQRQSGDIHGAIHPAYTQKIPAEFRSVLQCHKNGPGRRCGPGLLLSCRRILSPADPERHLAEDRQAVNIWRRAYNQNNSTVVI